MMPSHFFVYALTIWIFVIKVRSQVIVFESSNACDSKSVCLRIGQCTPYKSLPNWREVGKSCNDKTGNHRRVCCPKLSEEESEFTSRKPTTIHTTHSGIRYEDEDDRPRRPFIPEPGSCDANSVCMPIRTCRPYRSLPNWRNIGVTCGPGQGSFRRVCCPNRNQIVVLDAPTRAPTPPRIPPSTRTPPTRTLVTTPFNNENIFDQGECGQARPRSIQSGQVMGGKNATEGQWPWMAAIRIRERTGIFTPWCTGFLIDRRHVISAAHCFHDNTPRNYIARIGRVNQEEADTYEFNRIVVPQGYTRGLFYNDIAVLTLTRDVDVPDFNPVCLPDEILANRDLVGYGTAVTGWGTDSPNGSMSIVLREVRQMPVVSNADCNVVFQRTLSTQFGRQFPQGINEGFICAGFPAGERDACGGDSGGPLMYQNRNRWFVIGVVSFGFSCGQPGVPGGYTRVTEQMNWLFANTRD